MKIITICIFFLPFINIGIYSNTCNMVFVKPIQKINNINVDSVKNEYENKIVNIANKVYLKYLNKASKKTIIIVDFSKPMEQNRLFVVDVDSSKIILSSMVCHGIGSGNISIPTKFSDKEGSKMSSKGVMLTAETYYGVFGYSMKVDGLQKNINLNARSRSIVFHDSSMLSKAWSWGCFSTPKNVNKKLIDLTKNGSLIFVFSEQKDIAGI